MARKTYQEIKAEKEEEAKALAERIKERVAADAAEIQRLKEFNARLIAEHLAKRSRAAQQEEKNKKGSRR